MGFARPPAAADRDLKLCVVQGVQSLNFVVPILAAERVRKQA